MKKLISGLLLAAAMFSPAAGMAQSHPAYGFLVGSDDYPLLINHLVSFDLDTENVTLSDVVMYSEWTTAGAWAEGHYYVAGSAESSVDGQEHPTDLMIFDLESGSISTVAPLTGFNRFINDMTYDNSRDVMYATARLSATDKTSYHALYSINLQTGVATRIGDNLGRRMSTLACSYDGELYGVDSMGTLCSIDPETGTAEEIGPTGVLPSGRQSMEFDHSTGTLYWACKYQKMGTSIILEVSDLRTVDLESGQSFTLKSMGSNTQIAGLYIPYVASHAGTPAAVANLSVVPDPSGAKSATLSWTNPSEAFNGGGVLTSISRVEIYRDGVKVGEVNDARPGQPSSFVDNIAEPQGALYTYKVVAFNAVGAGAPTEKSVFVGHDVPSAVGALTLTRTAADAVAISWNAPVIGANGGFISTPLSYNVKRLPDGHIVASASAATSVTDGGITSLGNYYYEVTATSDAGDGPSATTSPVVLGPVIALPYSCDFTISAFEKWQIIDGNADGVTWIRERSSAFSRDLIRYASSATENADDYVMLHCVNIKAGNTYKVKYDNVAYAPNTLQFLLLRNGDVSDVAQVVQEVELPRRYNFAQEEFSFVATEGGLLNPAIRVTSAAGSSNVMISSFSIEEVLPFNLAAVGVKGSARPVVGSPAVYDVTVENRGTQSVSSFTVSLVDGEGNQLVSQTYNGALAPQAQTRVSLVWTPAEGCSATFVCGKVFLEGDGAASDDISDPLAITVQPAGSPELIEIGREAGKGTYHPFNLYDERSAALNIYQASEIGQQRGRISRLEWGYVSNYYSVPEMPVKIYLANTDRTSAAGGWLPADEMTLVYDGVLSMEKGAGTLGVDLDTPFLYTGSNLAVVTVNMMNSYVSAVNFPYYNSPVEGNSCYSVSGNALSNGFDFTQEGRLRTGTSMVSVVMQTTGNTISGIVSDADGNPVANATVHVVENGAASVTGADGRYSLEFMTDGEYHVTVSCFGYPDSTVTIEVNGSDVNRDIELSAIGVHDVSGTVIDAQGLPIASAKVTAHAYETLETMTDAQGCFSFENVVDADNVTLTASKAWYNTSSVTIPFGVDVAADPIVLQYSDYSPVNPTAEISENAGVVGWDAPASEAKFCYDSGKAATQIGFNDTETGTYAIGTAFRQPMRLESVEWMTMFEGGPHYVVHLYIYDLDEEGNPTSTLLYSERSIFNNDGEMTKYILPEAIDAPRGCLVTVNYPGFIGLAVDDKSPSHPYRENTYFFTSDFNSGKFSPMDGRGLDGNLMIRAYGRPYPWNMDQAEGVDMPDASAQPDWRKYRVWRQTYTGGVAGEEILVTEADVTANTVTDRSITSAPVGIYRYKVASVNPDGSLSTPAYTGGVIYRMLTEVTVPVSTNSFSGNAEGAQVTLTSADGVYSYSATVAAGASSVVFPEVWKGRYNVVAALAGFNTASATADLSLEDSYTLAEIELQEKKADPSNLSVVAEEGTTDRAIFRWNESGEIFDDFETYDNFKFHPSGDIAWSYIDGDGATTVAEQAYSYPGRQQPHAFICFNPYATVPSMIPDIESAVPYSGQKVLASFWGVGGSDDYIISPRLTYFDPVTFSVQARRRSRTYLETFHLGYSTTTAEPEAFTWGNVCDPEYDGWMSFSLKVPAEAKYVAVHSTSEDGLTLYLDDIKISSGSGMPMRAIDSAPEVRYVVTLDGEKVGETEECYMPLSGLAPGKHTVTVKAIYGSGESNETSIDFDLVSAIGSVSADNLVVRPNPATDFVTLSVDFAEARIFSAGGAMLARYDGADGRVLDVASLPRGVQLLTVEFADGSVHTVRLVLR